MKKKKKKGSDGTNRKQIRVADSYLTAPIINIKYKWTKYFNLKAEIVGLEKKEDPNDRLILNIHTGRSK